MRWLQWLPGTMRVALRGAAIQADAVRSALRFEMRERPCVVPHTPAELAAVAEEARRVRAARLREGGGAAFRELRVVAVRRPTADAVTIVFENAAESPIRFRPGQYLSLLVELDGELLRRAYSLCSDPADEERVAVTVKRVADGRVSNHLNDRAAAGQLYRTLGPSGDFGLEPEAGARRRVVLVAAGAGVTPLLSVGTALCRAEPDSRLTLVYGNRRAKDILFRGAWERLRRAHPNLDVTHVLTRPGRAWKGPRGRLSGAVLGEVLPVDPAARYLVCGPPGMMAGVVTYLREAGVPEENVTTERFSRPGDATRRAATGAVHEVRFRRSGVTIAVRDDTTVLDAGLTSGLPLSFSCTMGGCASCRVRLVEGEVEMEEPNCLTEAERERGECLACVARPRSALVIDA